MLDALAGSALQSLPSRRMAWHAWHGCVTLPRFIARLREPQQLNELRDRAMQHIDQQQPTLVARA